jgi:hypothetical protein
MSNSEFKRERKIDGGYFNVEVGRIGDKVWIDYVPMSLTSFENSLIEYLEMKRPFRVCPACCLVTTGQINKVRNIIKDAGGKLV